jgi:hypothetical protein
MVKMNGRIISRRDRALPQGGWVMYPTSPEAQRMTENDIGTIVVDCAIAVHRELGPKLFENVYEIVLDRGIKG